MIFEFSWLESKAVACMGKNSNVVVYQIYQRRGARELWETPIIPQNFYCLFHHKFSWRRKYESTYTHYSARVGPSPINKLHTRNGMKDEKLAEGFLHHHQQQLQLAQQQLASQKVGSVTHLLSFQKQTLPLISKTNVKLVTTEDLASTGQKLN